MSRNRFASTVVTSLEWQAALEQQCHDLASSFASGVDLLVVFVSPHYQPELEEIVGVLIVSIRLVSFGVLEGQLNSLFAIHDSLELKI